jgi:hypothetical protein
MAKRTKTIAVTVKAIAESCGYESAHPNTDGSQLQLIKGYTSVLLSIEETQKLLLKIAGSEFKGVTPTTPGYQLN